MNQTRTSLAALLLAAAASAQAGISSSGKAALEAPVAVKEESAFDQIWGLTKLYENEDNPVLQELRFTGRYHGQYHWSAGNDTSDEGWEDRRFRLGLEAKLFNDITLKGEMVSGSDFDPFYNGFTELYLQWNVFRSR
jgi:opacity protein-like surface antigen